MYTWVIVGSTVMESRWEVAVATSTPTTRADDRPDWEVKRGELQNCTVEPGKIKLLLHNDLIYQIQLWWPVISLLRFKCVCRPWRATIESSDFIKQHLQRHHHDPSLRDKNRSLIYLISITNSSITFALTSVEGFEVPSVMLQLNCSNLHGCFPHQIVELMSYDGIICLHYFKCGGEQGICLWNPATKQSRVLPQLPFLDNIQFSIGFGFDIKTNDYKVVKFSRGSGNFSKMGFGVYSLNTSSWKSATIVFPSFKYYINPKMPFNKGTCFFWWGYDSPKNGGIICFDFSSEMFRFISLPCTGFYRILPRTGVVHDKITCALSPDEGLTELWVFDEYGTVNESWTKLYTFDTDAYFRYLERPIEGVSMNGNYVFFIRMDQMCRLNVVTKEINCFALKEGHYFLGMTLVGFKESLVSIEEGNKE